MELKSSFLGSSKSVLPESLKLASAIFWTQAVAGKVLWTWVFLFHLSFHPSVRLLFFRLCGSFLVIGLLIFSDTQILGKNFLSANDQKWWKWPKNDGWIFHWIWLKLLKKKKKKLMVLELSAKTTFQEKLLWVKDQMFLSNQFTGLLDPKYLWKESIII